jgi:hypothetical protein
MKKFFKAMTMAAVALAAVSCAKEMDNTESAVLSQMSFTAGHTTRTVLAEGYAVNWVAGNSISIFDGAGNRQFSTTDSGASATFTGTADDTAPEYYALYPYSGSATCSAGVITTTLSSAQTAVKGTFDPEAGISVAHSASTSLHFLNACSMVAVNLQKYSDIVSVTLSGLNNEDIAGDLSISFDGDGKPVATVVANASKTVTLAPAAGVFEEGIYYIVVAPGTYSAGFNIQLKDSKNRTVDLPQGGSVPLTRASIKAYTVKNPYWFYRCIWGNNLGLTPAKDYANQYRASEATDVNTLGTIASTLIDEDGNTVAKVSAAGEMITKNNNIGSIRSNAGYTFQNVTSITKPNQLGIMVIRVTNGGENVGATSVLEPIFVSYLQSSSAISFAPFAIMANPRTGGTYDAGATHPGVTSDNLLIDWRRTFNYYNIGGPSSHVNGAPSVTGSFLEQMWHVYYDAAPGKTFNTGSKDPVSWYTNSGMADREKPLCYIHAGDYKIVVNAEKWKYDGAYANGAFSGQMTYVTDGDADGINGSSNQIFPIWIWFDERF